MKTGAAPVRASRVGQSDLDHRRSGMGFDSSTDSLTLLFGRSMPKSMRAPPRVIATVSTSRIRGPSWAFQAPLSAGPTLEWWARLDGPIERLPCLSGIDGRAGNGAVRVSCQRRPRDARPVIAPAGNFFITVHTRTPLT